MPFARASMIIAFLIFAVGITGAYAFSTVKAKGVAELYPPLDSFTEINGSKMHAVHVQAPENPELPPLVFIHGASSNLRDLMTPLRSRFEGRAEMLFVDRPGHGWSERGNGNDAPDGQAKTIAAVMKTKGIEKAIIIGHSFGGAVTAAFAVEFPEMTAGLVFLSPASHSWPTGVAWYNHLTAAPVIGWLFANTLAVPAAKSRLAGGVACVFAPNKVPDNYMDNAAIPLLLRPQNFRSNAIDIAGLNAHVTNYAPRYKQIKAPTVIITGDADDIVYPNIHSEGLKADIEGAQLIWVKNLGHKPDYIATDLVVAAIETVSGQPHDLAALARQVEEKIATDAETCGGSDSKSGDQS